MISRLMDISAPRLGSMLIPTITWRLPPSAGSACALTFDDGPSPGATTRVLDVLAASHIRATFFVLADSARRHPEIIDRIIANGHDVGLHGLDHRDPWKSRTPVLIESLDQAMDEVADLIGKAPIAYRPPFGHITPALLRWSKEQALHVVMWDILAGDFRRNVTPISISGRVHTHARPGSIIVLHDNESAGQVAADSLPGIIAELERLELSPITLSQALT